MQGIAVPHTPGVSWAPGRAARCPKPFSSATTTRWMARHAPAHQPLQRHLTRATPPREDQDVNNTNVVRHLYKFENDNHPPSRDDIKKEQGAADSSSQGGVSRLVAAVAILAAAAAAAGLKDKVHDLEDLITASGYLGPVMYAGAYTTATVLLFPASVLTLAAGYLFGPIKGTAVVSVSSTAGACLAFLVSRYLARPLVESKVADNPKFQAVYRSITADGAKLVLLLRLSPLVPFSLLNYGLGITQVRFLDYALASWVGMLPGTFAYVYLGSLGKVAADAAGDGSAQPSDGGFGTARLVLYAVGAVATIWATKLISAAASKAIDSEQGQDGAAAAGSKDGNSL